MSSFLSNKLLQYRGGASAAVKIETDLYCTSCGYNVRGLHFGRNCPECGEAIKNDGGIKDMLLSGEWADRKKIAFGLALASACLIIAALARAALFIALVFIFVPFANDAYLWLGLGLSAAWTIGAWLLTPERLDAHYYKLRWLRLTARYSQLLWTPAYAMWLLGDNGLPNATVGDALLMWNTVVRGAAGVGALFFAAWLMRLAVDAELDDAARRINLAIWMLPLPTLLLAPIPAAVPWIALVLIGMVLLVWCWYVLLMGRGVLAMQRHVSWALRIGADRPNRMARMDQTRRELDAEVASQVRPTGPALSDLPLEKPRS